MDITNSYCKPQQRADRWKMSENSKFSEKYLRKNGPGAASAKGRKSKFWHNTPNEWLGKVPKFHDASANGFWYRSEKPSGGRFGPPPPVIGLRTRSWQVTDLWRQKLTSARPQQNSETLQRCQCFLRKHLFSMFPQNTFRKFDKNFLRKMKLSKSCSPRILTFCIYRILHAGHLGSGHSCGLPY